MSTTRSLGFDAWGTYGQFLHWDADGYTVSFKGDNTARMEANQKLRNDGTNGFTPSHDLRAVIELDNASIMLIASMYGVQPLSREFDDVVLRLAQSSEWRNIKTVDGGIRDRMKLR